jgi:hypothetical protein
MGISPNFSALKKFYRTAIKLNPSQKRTCSASQQRRPERGKRFVGEKLFFRVQLDVQASDFLTPANGAEASAAMGVVKMISY